MNTKNTKELKSKLTDVQKILDNLDIPAETKLTLLSILDKLTVEQFEEMVKTIYQRLIDQKTEELILKNDSEYYSEKESLDNESIAEINKVINN